MLEGDTLYYAKSRHLILCWKITRIILIDDGLIRILIDAGLAGVLVDIGLQKVLVDGGLVKKYW